MTRAQCEAYLKWFLGVIPERVQTLENLVRLDPRYALWAANRSPESLTPLGEWFAAHVTARPMTEGEIALRTAQIPEGASVSHQELSGETLSYSMDVGIYLSQVLVQFSPRLRWTFEMGRKSYVDFGKPVLSSFGGLPLNPVHVVTIAAYGISRGSKNGHAIRNLFDVWSSKTERHPA